LFASFETIKKHGKAGKQQEKKGACSLINAKELSEKLITMISAWGKRMSGEGGKCLSRQSPVISRDAQLISFGHHGVRGPHAVCLAVMVLRPATESVLQVKMVELNVLIN